MAELIEQFNIAPFVVFYLLAFLCGMLLSPLGPVQTSILLFFGLCLRLLASRYLPYAIVGDDEYGYYLMGEDVSSSLAMGSSGPWGSNAWGNVTGVMFYLFGSSIYTMRPFNTLLSIISACLLARLALQRTNSSKFATKLFAFMIFLPPLIFISCIAVKEQMIAFCLVLVLYGFLNRASLAGMLYPIGLVALFIFRRDLALVVLPLSLLHIVVNFLASSRLGSFSKTLLFGTSLTLFVLFVTFSIQSEHVLSSKSASILLGEDVRGRDTLMSSEATYAKFLDINNPGSWINLLLVPLQQTYFPSPLRPVKTPFPEVYVEAFFITALIYIFLPYFFLACLEAWPNTDRLLPISIYLAVFLTSAFSILTYAPESLRYRLPGMPIFFYVAFIGMYHPSRYRVMVLRLWWVSVVIVSAIYLAI